MNILSYITLACMISVSLCQFDGPTPPRPIIPGALPLGAGPVGGARPVLRRRPQAQPGVQDLPPPRRIAGGRGAGTGAIPNRRLPSQLLEQSLVSPRPSRPVFSAEPVIRAPQPPQISLSATPAPIQPSSIPQQYSPQPLSQISPRPVVEAEDEDEVISTHHIAQTPPQQLSFRPSPIDDLPVPTRPQFHRPATPQPLSDDDDLPSQFIRQGRPQQQEVRHQQQEVIRQSNRQSNQERPRQHARQQQQQQQQQQQYTRQQQVVSRPANKDYERPVEDPRKKKPEVQNLRKYRTDNEDGSITWGFENDDGTYKEETIGTDCITRGKYGYVDPDGVRREFSYESGILCDPLNKRDPETQETNEGYIDYSNNKYVFPNGDAIDLENMVKNKARRPAAYGRP